MSKFLKVLYGSFVPGLKSSWKVTQRSYDKLGLRMMLKDFASVIASIGFVFIPAFLVGLLFLALPQGRDTLLLVVEKMTIQDYRPLLGLIAGIVCWSLFSELGVRYAINISDNSGMNLSNVRVEWRKEVQSILAAFFLLWPPIVVFFGFVWAMFTAVYFSAGSRWLYFGICLLLMILTIIALSFLYFHKFGKPGPNKPMRTLFGRRALPLIEQRWLGKLYGIYNDYIYYLPKSTSFQTPYRKDIQKFNDHFLNGPPAFLAGFPQNQSVMVTSRLIPQQFKLQDAAAINDGSGELFKWVYCVPTNFYSGLHRQVKRMFFVSALFLVLISLIPAESGFFRFFGAPGLVCLAFACYTGLYSGLLFLDKALLRNWKISVRLLLCILFLFSSFYNSDHPARLFGQKSKRPQMERHFKKWFANYKKSMDAQHPNIIIKQYPVVFICAEGGAFRTGAYTAMFLTKLDSLLAARKTPVDFRNSIFAMSGVSGGAVGLGFYNALAFRDQVSFRSNPVSRTKVFFQYDSLSPLIGKMLYGEFINLFIWCPITRFDRAAALEKTWETAYQEFIGENAVNTYKEPFILADSGMVKPMLVINTTEIETGQQCWVTNIDAAGLQFHNDRDLLTEKVGNARYSTAINFSSRFPLFSPGAEIEYQDSIRLHYLDGGYVENTGSASMLEILQMLKYTPEFCEVKPIVITLLFSEEDKAKPNIHAFNELTEVFAGIYNTRSGRSKTSRHQLTDFVRSWNHGVMIDAALSESKKDVPMNWVLSAQSINNIEKDIKLKLDTNGNIFRSFVDNNKNYLQYTK